MPSLNEKQREVIKTAQSWWSKQPAFLDTETTGLGENDQVIEVALVDHSGEPLIDTLVQPTCPISTKARAIHGISDEELADQPSWSEIHDKVESIVGRQPVVLYNENFDRRLIRQTARQQGNRNFNWGQTHCAMNLYAKFHGDYSEKYDDYKWVDLKVAGDRLNIDLTESNLHRARVDAELTRRVIQSLATGPPGTSL